MTPPIWVALAAAAGGYDPLAAEFGVHPATLWRWIAGTTKPGRHTRAAVNAWAKERGLEGPFAD